MEQFWDYVYKISVTKGEGVVAFMGFSTSELQNTTRFWFWKHLQNVFQRSGKQAFN